MQIKSHILILDDGTTYNLPKLPNDTIVNVWKVPEEYRANQLFVSVTEANKPKEFPACNPDSIEFLGELPLPSHEEAILKEAQLNKIQEVYAIRNNKIYQDSVPYTFPGDTEPDGVQFRNENDRQNLQDIGLVAQTHINNGNTNAQMFFMAKSNILKILTPTQALEMCKTLKERGDSIYQRSWALKVAIQGTTSLEDIYNIDISGGWPE